MKYEETIQTAGKVNTLRVLSLFSGCGGLDLGIEGDFLVLRHSIHPEIHPYWDNPVGEHWSLLPKTRFQNVFANDINQDAQTAWRKYFVEQRKSKADYHLESIVDLVKRYRAGEKDIFPDGVDVVTGGFPCQDFSVAGKRLGFFSDKGHHGKSLDSENAFEESRGTLYLWMREVISITKPKLFIAENVKGLVNLGDAKQIIEEDFSTIAGNGYLVVPAKVLHAADYGVPQSRERVIFFGFRKDQLREEALAALSMNPIPSEYDPYPVQTHSFTQKNNSLMEPVTVRQALIDLLEPSETKDLSQQKFSKAKFMGKHCQGQTEVKLDSIGPTIRSEHHGNIEFRRLSAPNGGVIFEELFQGLPERRLTIRECARIQTFPDDYEFVISSPNSAKNLSASSAYKIIGNAVPPLLAYHIAYRMDSLWEKLFKGE